MQLLMSVMQVVQILAALGMIGLVLVQHGKGADMGASFGSGASGSLFGATGSANFLSRSTAVCAAVFFACTLALAYFGSSTLRPATGSGSSILDQAVPTAPAASAAPSKGEIPGLSAPAPSAPGPSASASPSSNDAAGVPAPSMAAPSAASAASR